MKSNGFTNNEKRALIYASALNPTDSKLVTSETSLEDLNLNWREVDLPEKDRTKHVHRLHPYLGKFIPQLVEIFLRKYFKPGETVLDPFSGSGTTLVQANELGINSIGCDISAFNILLGKVKTAEYDISLLKKEVTDILDKLNNICSEKSIPIQPSLWQTDTHTNYSINDDYLNKWFDPKALSQLLAYRELIFGNNYHYSDLMKIILSRSARSARLTTHFDLDFPSKPQTEPYYCYKHGRICKPTDNAIQFIRRYSLDAVNRIQEFSLLRTNASVTLYHADSRSKVFPVIDGAITSPPYVGLIDYHAQHEYAYHLLGLDDNRNLEIGPAINGSSQKAKFDYQNDILSVFNNVLNSIKIGGRLIVVAGDRNELYPSIGERLGIEEEAVITRHVNRRTGRRTSEFFESIFIWRKTKN